MRDELAKCGIQIETQAQFNPKLDYDCFIFSRIPNNPDVFPLIDVIKRNGKKIIWDIDDELWNIPETNRASQFYTKPKIMWLNYYFSMSTKIVASTNNLAKSIENTWKIEPNKIVVLENLIEEDAYKRFYREQTTGVTRILWSGSDSHEGDLKLIDCLFDHYRGNEDVQLIFFGHMPDRFKSLAPHDLMFYPWANRKYYEGTLSAISPHIAIIPLEDNQFNICKSAIKYYEMAMSGAVCVASNVSPYSDVIEHRQNGFLFSNASDLVYICDEIINMRDNDGLDMIYEYDDITKEGKNNVMNNYSWDTDNKRRRDWFSFFKSIPDL